MPEKVVGKIEKRSGETFGREKRKLILVYFILPLPERWKEKHPDFEEKLNSYWKEVKRKLENLQRGLGKVKRIYHEWITQGEKELSRIKEMNEKAYLLVKELVEEGATLEKTEKEEFLTQNMDWGRFLALRPQSPEVFARLWEFYEESLRKRDEYISRRIEETLRKEEIGVLFIREQNSLHLSPDIEIFYISPPSMEEIRKYLRDISGEKKK